MRAMHVTAAGLSVAVVALWTGCASRPGAAVGEIARPDDAWTAKFRTTEGWTGGDGCASVSLADGRVLWLFSDSTVGRVRDGRHAEGTTIVNNAVAIGSPDAEGKLRFAWGPLASDDGKPRALFTPTDKDRWYWLAGGAAAPARGPLVIFLWSMGRTGKPDAGVWDFRIRGTDAAVIDNPADEPSHWRTRVVPLFPEDGGKPGRVREWGSAVLSTPDATYIFGVDVTDTWHKQLLVARCKPDRLAVVTEWTFWSGTSWSTKPQDAASVADDAVDEFSVMLLDDGRFAMIQIQPNLGQHIGIRIADRPEGPWSELRHVYQCPEPQGDRRLIVYSAKGHPEVSDVNGLVVSYCVNSTDLWHMLGDASIYRPRFVRVPWASVKARSH